MTNQSVESICEFGATARGTADGLSDRDVLIVASDPCRAVELKAHWAAEGCSVGVYSPSRFNRICDQGSLFVQHLKFEGKLLGDSGRWLEHRLRHSQPKTSYKSDAVASVALALPMERLREDETVSQRLIAADLAFVAFRNFGICHLANTGHLSFDFGEIVNRVAETLSLTGAEKELLLKLRLGKVSYRSGGACDSLDARIGELRRLLSKVFGARSLGQISADTPVRKLTGGYAMLRDFEAKLLANFDHTPSEKEMRDAGLGQVWNWIRDPRAYSWNVKNFSDTDTPSIDCIRRGLPST